MKYEAQAQHDEPAGIVISRGRDPETTPRFTAYMWAPGPEGESDADVEAAKVRAA